MAKNKTKETVVDPHDFIRQVPDEQKRRDSEELIKLMSKVTGKSPKMWGPTIVGFGKYRYKYDSGREMDWMQIAFSPRKQNITLYVATGFDSRDELLTQLGNHSCGKGCVYIKRLSDVHLPTLKKLIKASVKHVLKDNLSK